MNRFHLTMLLWLATVTPVAFGSPVDQSQGSRVGPPSEPPTVVLSMLSRIPTWAADLQKALLKIGDDIDRTKAKRSLLPHVVEIQTDLSGLEDLNGVLSRDLARDNIDRGVVQTDLLVLQKRITSVETDFSELRSSVQRLSLPELTQLDRTAEIQFGAKRVRVQYMLEELEYDPFVRSGAKFDIDQMRKKSENLITLLHSVQDSLGQLHQFLER